MNNAFSEKNFIPTGENISNNDMNMSAATLASMDGHVRAAMANPKIKETFEDFEREANRTKKWHHRAGLLSLIILILILEFTLVRLFLPHSKLVEEMEMPALFLGLVPGICLIWTWCTRSRERWTLARYKAERIRHWKFQQLLDGAYIERLKVEPNGKDPSFDEGWQRFMDELNFGVGAMRDYVSVRPFVSPFWQDHGTRFHYKRFETFRSAALVYKQFRLELQLGWFSQENERYARLDKWTESLSGLLLLASVIAAFLESVLFFIPSLSSDRWVSPGLSTLGIGMVLLSAALRVYRSASGVSESAERYHRLSSQLRWYMESYQRILNKDNHHIETQDELFNLIFSVERHCHGELSEFIRVADKSDYFV